MVKIYLNILLHRLAEMAAPPQEPPLARLLRPAAPLTEPAKAGCLMELGHHLFTQQLERLHHLLMWDFGAAIHFSEDAIETKGFL